MGKDSLIDREFESLQKELDVLSLIIAKRRKTSLDEIEVRAAALSLAALYSGMESVLKQLLTSRNETWTEGPNWHAALLQKSNIARIITDQTLQDLKGFLAFRHFVRHAYSFQIDPKAIDAVLDKAPDVVKRFIAEVKEARSHQG